MVIITSWVSVGYGSDEGTGAHTLKVESASDDSNFNSRRKKRKRGFGEIHPRCLGDPPLGGRTGKGCARQAPKTRRA